MGDVGDDFRAWREANRAMRARYGVACPQCKRGRPRAHPSILLPQQRCRVDGYRDPRPRLNADQLGEFGIEPKDE